MNRLRMFCLLYKTIFSDVNDDKSTKCDKQSVINIIVIPV